MCGSTRRTMSADALPPFAERMHLIPVSCSEFYFVARDYPIIFIPTQVPSNTVGAERTTFLPTALLGLEPDENLLIKNHAWEDNHYVPAYLRRFPFCVTRIVNNTNDSSKPTQTLICVEQTWLDQENGSVLFDDQEQATTQWQPMLSLINEFEEDLQRTQALCDLLAEHQLIVPFTFNAELTTGRKFNLGGMYRVDEEKLAALPQAALQSLIQKGAMRRIYEHISSLETFRRLLERKVLGLEQGEKNEQLAAVSE